VRAPVIGDIDLAVEILGFDGTADEAFVELRARLLHDAAHDYTRRGAGRRGAEELLRCRAAARAERVAEWRSRCGFDFGRRTWRDSFVLPEEYVELRESVRRSPGSTSPRTRPRPTSTEEYPWGVGTRGVTPGSPDCVPEAYGGQAAASSPTRSQSRR